jgi:hypothetical protein
VELRRFVIFQMRKKFYDPSKEKNNVATMWSF